MKNSIINIITIICFIFISCDPAPQHTYIRNYLDTNVNIFVEHKPFIDFNEEINLKSINCLINDIKYNSYDYFTEKIKIKKLNNSIYSFTIKPRSTVFLEPIFIANPIKKVEIIYGDFRKEIIFYGKDINRTQMIKLGFLEYNYPVAIINIK